MQQFIIRKIPQFNSATTQSMASELKFINDYWSYSSTIGGDVVNQMNVRSYLDKQENETVATQFFTFLSQNSSQLEMREIISDNNKLSAIFNDYYNKVVRQNITPTNQVIQEEISGSTATTFVQNYFINDDGQRSIANKSFLVTNSEEESYYVPIFINTTINTLPNENFGVYEKTDYGPAQTGVTTILKDYVDLNSGVQIYDYQTANTIQKQILLQSFVDYSFDDNESEFWSNGANFVSIPEPIEPTINSIDYSEGL